MIEAVREPASFRDPCGFVFRRDGKLYRQVNDAGKADFDLCVETGLWDELIGADLFIAAERHDATHGLTAEAAYVLEPQAIGTISYPYEWCFSQLREAALMTLEIQRRALGKGMRLKDASAYNVQFCGTAPIFIDSLSLESSVEGAPWQAYRQFCMHFLAPLALMSNVDVRLGQLLRVHLDGVPLDLASKLMPRSTRWRPGLAMHIHMHAKAESKAEGGRHGTARISETAQLALVDSLKSTVEKLAPPSDRTEWGDYYSDTNYSASAMQAKRDLVARLISEIPSGSKSCWDLGANNGEFTQIAAASGLDCVAWDMDPLAVESAHRRFRGQSSGRILPLVLDLANPSPAQGWAHQERMSWLDRGPADVVMGLALVHHLAIGNNVPLDKVADLFADCGRTAIVEFVPKSDSQVQRILKSRSHDYRDYTQESFEAAFRSRFKLIRSEPIPGTERTLYLFKQRDA